MLKFLGVFFLIAGAFLAYATQVAIIMHPVTVFTTLMAITTSAVLAQGVLFIALSQRKRPANA